MPNFTDVVIINYHAVSRRPFQDRFTNKTDTVEIATIVFTALVISTDFHKSGYISLCCKFGRVNNKVCGDLIRFWSLFIKLKLPA